MLCAKKLEPEPARPLPQNKKVRAQDSIAFSSDDLKEVRTPHDDLVVISLVIAKHDIKRVLVDNRSSADILFYDAFQKMKLPSRRFQVINAPLVVFTGNSIQVEGAIALSVTAGTEHC